MKEAQCSRRNQITMSASHNEKPPIIIVKRHAEHDDSHGGQWKVAYADFVTAMMAFFLIMWLLASTTQSERAAIAKYFTTTTLFALTAGNGVMNGGQSVMNGADAKLERLSPRSQDSKRGRHDDGNDRSTAAPEASRDRIERQRFEALKAELERLMRQGDLRAMADNLAIEMTPEGLRIQIFDRDGAPMFAPGEINADAAVGRHSAGDRRGAGHGAEPGDPDRSHRCAGDAARRLLQLGAVRRPGQRHAPPA